MIKLIQITKTQWVFGEKSFFLNLIHLYRPQAYYINERFYTIIHSKMSTTQSKSYASVSSPTHWKMSATQPKSYVSVASKLNSKNDANETKYIRPRMPIIEYDIIKKSADRALGEIMGRINNNYNYKCNPDYTKRVNDAISCESDQIVYYGFLYESDPAINRRINGKGGCAIYDTITEYDILYLWFAIRDGKYEFWSLDRNNLICAMDRIRYRIHKFKYSIPQKELETKQE